MNTYTQTIKQVEEAHKEYGLDSLTFQLVMQDLKFQLREYCEEHGIKEVNNIDKKEVKE